MFSRMIFLHSARVADLVLTLKFDRFLSPRPDKTYIFYGPWDLDVDLKQTLTDHSIDTTTFEIIPDHYIWRNNPINVDIYQFGGWIAQQLIKFLALDLVGCHDYVLIQDCDTFSIQSYEWIKNNQPQMYFLENTSHSDQYYHYVEKFTGHKRQLPHCFVSEFMPLLREDWIDLKNQIENNYQLPWLEAMHKQFLSDSNANISKNADTSYPPIWFSEYELLGNWAVQKHPDIKFILQKRLPLKILLQEKNTSRFTVNIKRFNCICNSGLLSLDDVDDFADYLNQTIQ